MSSLLLDPGGASGPVVDDSICPVCMGTTYVGQTIACETCQRWFHFGCVGVKDGDPCVVDEDKPFFCPECSRKKERAKAKAEKKKAKAKAAQAKAKEKEKKSSSSNQLKIKISLSPQKAATTTTTSEALGSPRKRRKSEVEEERWLDAVEAGEDVNKMVDPELRSIKDPKLMTARQRAMIGRQGSETETESEPLSLEEEGHMALDYGYKKKAKAAEETELSLRMKALKSAKRKEIEAEKREADKKKTMDRLLKKKDSRAAWQAAGKAKPRTREEPKISYRLDAEGGASISLPPGVPFPFERRGPVPPPKQVKCAVGGCQNLKKYNCSKSGKPICSLECYKKNNLVLA